MKTEDGAPGLTMSKAESPHVWRVFRLYMRRGMRRIMIKTVF
jgi:hypothetical protein